MKYLLFLLPLLLACSPKPERDGKCHLDATGYDATGPVGVNWCEYKGYWWSCRAHSNGRFCERGEKLPAEAAK